MAKKKKSPEEAKSGGYVDLVLNPNFKEIAEVFTKRKECAGVSCAECPFNWFMHSDKFPSCKEVYNAVSKISNGELKLITRIMAVKEGEEIPVPDTPTETTNKSHPEEEKNWCFSGYFTKTEDELDGVPQVVMVQGTFYRARKKLVEKFGNNFINQFTESDFAKSDLYRKIKDDDIMFFSQFEKENEKNAIFPCKAITLKITVNEDWKTRMTRNDESIPEGTEIILEGDCTNFYGYWYTTVWNGQYMYIDPNNVKIEGEKI